MTAYAAPVPLAAAHRLGEFTCASEEQTAWLRHHARQAHAGGAVRVFVVTTPGQVDVVAYYAWCMAQVALVDAPARLAKGVGRYPQPVALLARLGVHLEHERRGLGAGLLTDVLLRARALSGEIGIRALLVHAEGENALEFYRRLVPEFEASSTDPLHLMLLLKDIRKTLR